MAMMLRPTSAALKSTKRQPIKLSSLLGVMTSLPERAPAAQPNIRFGVGFPHPNFQMMGVNRRLPCYLALREENRVRQGAPI